MKYVPRTWVEAMASAINVNTIIWSAVEFVRQIKLAA